MKPNNPKVKVAPSISPIWVVPILALVIAAWLAINSWQQQGQEIEIIFDNASGIEVGKTQIRLKDVPVGKVTKVRLSADLSKVRVFAMLDRQVSEHLSENSRFWLVSPRISTSGVSNLGTLISGVYIVMEPGKPGEFHDVFQGLSEPPAVESDDQGTQFVLHSETLGSLDIGSPVYFRKLKVGEVTGYRLGDSGASVEIRIFIEAPHDRLVQTRSRFWNVSGMEFSVGADGVKAEMASVASLINGGIAFENGAGFEAPKRAVADHQFYLYSDRDSVQEERYTLRYFYRLKFSHSMRGLSVGAPVEFRGMKVGEVVDVQLASVDNEPDSLHVYISMEPQRLDAEEQPDRETFDRLLAELVSDGMRAQLKTASLITGKKYVDLSFPSDPAPGTFVVFDNFADIPTVNTHGDDLDQQLASIARKINEIPMDKIGQDLSQSVASLNKLLTTFAEYNTVQKVDKTLANVSAASEQFEGTMEDAQAALQEFSQAMRAIDSVMAPDSKTQYQLNEAFQSLQNTATSLNRLLEKLNRKPDALIFGNDDE